MSLRIQPTCCSTEVEALLSRCDLPVSDLGEPSPARLFAARVDEKLIGVVGVEAYGPVGLLRSLAVESARRRSGYGQALVVHAERRAAESGVEELYLLTTTAAAFFARRGYQLVSRNEAPEAIARSVQFTRLCPSSSTLMRKILAPAGAEPTGQRAGTLHK